MRYEEIVLNATKVRYDVACKFMRTRDIHKNCTISKNDKMEQLRTLLKANYDIRFYMMYTVKISISI